MARLVRGRPAPARGTTAPFAANRHHACAGQIAQSADAARQIVAPMSMSACVHAAGPTRGHGVVRQGLHPRVVMVAAASPVTIRPRTRRTFVSTAPTGSRTPAPPPREPCTARHRGASRASRGRAGPPSVIRDDRAGPRATGHARGGRSRGPATRAARPPATRRRAPGPSGSASMNRSHRSAARAACVCWAIASETRMAYGSLVRRNASARPLVAYQARIASWSSDGMAGRSDTSRRIVAMQGRSIAG